MGISNTEYQKYLNEILTFADDTNDVVKDSQGNIIFNRLNQLMSIKLKKSDKGILVEYNNALLPYRTFMAKYLANMDIMARHIIDKDPQIDEMYYVDGQASLTTDEGRIEKTALKLLDFECNRDVFIGSKICFVTANAGHDARHGRHNRRCCGFRWCGVCGYRGYFRPDEYDTWRCTGPACKKVTGAR